MADITRSNELAPPPKMGRSPVRIRLEDGSGYFHVVTRCHNQEFLLEDDKAKKALLRLMRKVEAFSGVTMLSYVLMDNHLHFILSENGAPDYTGEKHDAEIIRRIAALYGDDKAAEIAEHWEEWRGINLDSAVEADKRTYTSRMHNVSKFMKSFKERYTKWYNHEYTRSGTIWGGRFTSTMVQGNHNSLLTVAAYVELNPVRAGMVEDPMKYKWSSYGAATYGDKKAQAGLETLFRESLNLSRNSPEGEEGWKWISKRYRMALYVAGVQKTNDFGEIIRKGFTAEQIEKVLTAGGSISFGEQVRIKAAVFTRAVILGGEEFVSKHTERVASSFGLQRPRVPKPTAEGLFAFRCKKSEGPPVPG